MVKKGCEKMKTKIVFAVYHNVNSEARSMEFLKCCTQIGDVDLVSYAIPAGVDGVKTHIINKKSQFALFSFLNMIMKTIKEVKPDVVVLHDNDCSAVIPKIRKKYPNIKIVYDSSELYISDGKFSKTKKGVFGANGFAIWLKSKLTRFRKVCEKKYLKMADLVFAANIERAKIMKEYFCLETVPSVFDNIHRIDDEYDEVLCREKFGNIFQSEKFNVLFGGGISEERKTFDYIESFLKLDDRFNLVIVGSASDVALKKYENIINTNEVKNINYIGFISRAELKYCMQQSQASVVVFDKDSYNTLYCASGKCYESLFENVPILASENPPLKRLCEEDKIGVSNDNYSEAIVELYNNYDYYKTNVKEYLKTIDYDNRISRLKKELQEKVIGG